MKVTCHTTVYFILMTARISGQSDFFINPSFEGDPGFGNVPNGWSVCNPQSTPDLQPYETTLAPTDGRSYAGLVMRGQGDANPKNEDLVTALQKPLVPGTAYILSIDLAYAPYVRDNYTEYDKVPQLRISGGSQKCMTSQVYVVTEPIDNSEWVRYCFILTPETDITWLSFEVFALEFQAAYLLMDNISLEPIRITGLNHVCVGSRNQVYSLTEFKCASELSFHYTGNGVVLGLEGNSIIADFGADATDGELVVAFKNSLSEPATISFPITVDNSLPAGGTITGVNRVCRGTTGETYIAEVSNTAFYNWHYSGRGANIYPGDSVITIDFSPDATSGTLTMMPVNGCGTGAQLKHDITIVPIPANAGIISGEDQVCRGETATYQIDGITYATDYLWSFTGTGVTINDNNLNLTMNFGSDATGGYLTVTGVNECGEGRKSLEFIIFVDGPPDKANSISGKEEICSNDQILIYQTPEIPNATEYIWSFTGQGARVDGNSSQAYLNITGDMTNGIITVSGRNKCGTGDPSPAFKVIVNDLCDFFIPNAFSPNDDGKNDKFVIGEVDGTVQLIVFDKSGKVVYESNDYRNEWDGRDSSGRMLPTDTYWYVLTLPDYDKEMKGYVFLKR